MSATDCPSPRCVVVIVAHAGDRWLTACTESLAGALRPDDRLLLVDNFKNTQLDAACRGIAECTRISTPQPLGFAEANNFALVRGGLAGRYVCLLNQDTLSEAGWLDACIDCLESNPEIGAVSPLLRTYDGVDWDAGFRPCANESKEFVRDAERGGFGIFYEVPQVTAAAMVVRSDVLRRVGPFDPIFGSYYEDYDLCRRIREAGFRIGICGQGTVRHFGGSSTTTRPAERRRMRQVLRNRAIMQFRAAGDRRLPAIARYVTVTVPRNLLRGLARTPSSQPIRVQLAAYRDLLKALPRLSSRRRDRDAWIRYLQSIDWPGAAGTLENGHSNETVSPDMRPPFAPATDYSAASEHQCAGAARSA